MVRVVISKLGEQPLQTFEQFATLEPMEAPEPGPRQVVIAVASASVGWVDLLMASGQYQHVPTPPYTPGLEYAGTVHRAGADSGFTQLKMVSGGCNNISSVNKGKQAMYISISF